MMNFKTAKEKNPKSNPYSRKDLKILMLFPLALLSISTSLFAGQAEDMKAILDHSKPGFFTPQEMVYTPAPATLPKGAMISVMEGDPTQAGPFTMRLKLPENYSIPAHWHPGDEHITVISGNLMIGLGDKLDQKKSKVLPTGGFARIPPKVHHYAWTNEETVVQLHGQGPWGIMYVNPNDDPSGHNNVSLEPEPKTYYDE